MTANNINTATVTPVEGRVHIFFDDAEIASTLSAVKLEEPGRNPQIFVPLEAVHPGILEASETRKAEPGLGEAHYYTIKTLTADGPDEAWYYPYAEGEYGPVRDLLTFGGDRVKVDISQV
ncbi:Uncharacterized conserved protein, DUF427 family [Devosia crocina]|uniref:Uncharacterized conserved protein, DUF427 family n=1 Tax=Devosia crocina TaxID=429728 RepID=A0A1I7NP59_9HYPH|nr:DUF427 domain-containing protein [Devosia crocina]SFV36452.1 Uncharacterized conserved protein, DUF427 family [Devosia crocina]